MARPSAHLQKWLDRLASLADQGRAELASIRPDKLVMRAGCHRDSQGRYNVRLMGTDYGVSPTSFTVVRADTGDAPSPFTESLVLTYLLTADGTTPSGRWIGFRELPDGLFYVQAVQAYSGARLVRELAESGADPLAAFLRAGSELGGSPLDLGDAGYAFPVLPRVQMALTFWEGDDEFPSQATVLFEDTAAHYMPTDGLAILGSQLVDKLLEVASQAL